MTGPAPSRVRFPVFGTDAVLAATDARALAELQWVVQDRLDAIDRACSRFRPDSEINAVNRAAGRPTAASPLLRAAVRVALDAAVLTDGDVDPTVGEAMRLLGYDRDFAAVRSPGPPVVRIGRVPGWRLVEVNDETETVTVPAGVELDLGATAKAYAADTAAQLATDATGCGVLVGLGGDVAVAGVPPDGGWVVALADWHGASDCESAEQVRITSGGVATSSTTVRRWVRGGQQLHHILDPRTGRPAEVVWRTVSVAAASCVDANTASTAAVIRGARAPEWLASQELPARLVGVDGSVLRVGGWP